MMNIIKAFSNIILFVYLTGIFTSCNGQENSKLNKNIPDKQLTNLKVQPQIIRTQGITFGNIDCMLEEKNGNIWFCTGGEGIYCFDGISIRNFTTKDGLTDNYVNAVTADKKGNILFGTNKGICLYDGKKFTPFTNYNDASKKTITSILEDTESNIWFGTWNDGIYRYDGKTFTNFLNNDDYKFNLGVHNQIIMYILQDKKGNIWFSSWNGGGVWQYDGKIFKNFLPSEDYYRTKSDKVTTGTSQQEFIPNFQVTKAYTNATETISDDMVFSISEDSAGNIWFATRRHGACKFDGKTFTSFRENEGFVSYGISSIVEDRKGIIWFGTDKNGFYSFDGKTFKNYTEEDGLVSISVRSMLFDQGGNLWLGTRGFGLSRFDGETFTTFSEVPQ